MEVNELGQQVPAEVAADARARGCRGEVCYVYRDGDYGTGWPAASIGCGSRATRFRSANCELWKVPLGQGWVAFERPTRPSISYDPANDDWVVRAVPLIEGCIDELVKEFTRRPHLHRVEHSLHTRLMNLIASLDHVAGEYPIGPTREVTQLVHKEWPETNAREEKDGRGNFDIVVLSPRLLEACTRIAYFDEGLLPAPFVIEMGLNYGLEHYESDRSKLTNSDVHRGYLVHLLRRFPEDVRENASILQDTRPARLKTAFARVGGRNPVYKLLDAATIDPIG